MDLFAFKKFIGVIAMPLPICLILLGLALFAFALKRRKLGYLATVLAFAILLALSTPPLPNHLLADTERAYPQFDMAQKVNYIVILGCGHINDAALPITSQMRACSLYRAIEALRIFQANPGAMFVTSGRVAGEPFSNARMNKEVLMALGVDDKKIIAMEVSKDTEEEAINLAPLLHNQTFALVTSASHMKRAMGLFERQGLQPIPAPSEHLVKYSDKSDWLALTPGARNLIKAERWWYEVLGRTWLSIKNLFSD